MRILSISAKLNAFMYGAYSNMELCLFEKKKHSK